MRRSVRRAKPLRMSYSIPHAANFYVSAAEAEQSKLIAIQALRDGQCIELIYDGCERVLEVHTVGTTTAGNSAVSAYQVGGRSNSGPVPDWRLFRFDHCQNVRLSDQKSSGPRSDFRRSAKQFSVIVAEL